MIKIAYVINTIYSPTGGTEKQLLLLLKHLDRSRFAPVLCVLSGSPWLEREFDLCPLHVLGIDSLRSPGALLAFWRFVRFLKAERVDIVHSLFIDGMRVGIAAGRVAGVKKVIAVRRSQGYWMTPFDLKETRFLNRWVDLILANSHNTRNWTAEVEGFPAERIEVIHNGISLEPFSQVPGCARADFRASLGIPADAPAVGIVANLRPVKSIDVFLRAAGLVRAEIPSAHFVLVGEGDQEPALKSLAGELGLSECTHFLGARRDIPEILAGLDAGVLSSSSESFSNAIVEYLAAGLPVICTEVGGAREAVEDGVNGFVVPVGDPVAMAQRIIQVTGDREGRVAMQRANRSKAERLFSLGAMMVRYQGIYSGGML